MKTLVTGVALAAVALLLIGSAPTSGFAQCILNCPAGDGGIIGPGSGNKSPDLNGDTVVNIVDVSIFAAAYPPMPYNYCVDYNCDGIIALVDLSLFATHLFHSGNKPGFCQPGADHYKPYDVAEQIPILGPIVLDDQFGSIVVSQLFLSKVATPVEKNGQAMLDSVAHQTWWEFLNPEPQRFIRARDQFGEYDWALFDSRFLVNPALKFPLPGQEIPRLNHYKIYDAQGPLLQIDVVLRDQFETVTKVVLQGIYFGNPVRKTTQDGTVYEIVDPIAHMTCYLVDPPLPYDIPVRVLDQFFDGPVTLIGNECLCLPALKTEVIEPGSSEWERIRELFK